MPNMTLALPVELKAKMDQFKEINWSEVARQAIREKTMLLDRMNHMLSHSKLAEPEMEYHAVKIKKVVSKKHKSK